MTHPNDMSVWPEIACQRGHGAHATRTIPIELGGPTPYHDLAPIPRRFRRMFHMLVWDPAHYPVDGGPYCVDTATEALTRDGWKAWHDLEPGVDQLYGYDTETSLGRWTDLERMTVLPDAERRMLVMEGRHHSSVTTEDHRWWVERRRQAKRYRDGALVSISEAEPARLFATSAELTARDRVPACAPASDLPQQAKWSDAFVELVGWFWTEGHIRYSKAKGCTDRAQTVRISQSHRVNPENVASIRACLTALFGAAPPQLPAYRTKVPAPAWSERSPSTGRGDMTTFALNRAAILDLIEVAPGRSVRPGFIASLTQAQLLLFLDVSHRGDGIGPRRIAQRNGESLDAVQMAWSLLGRRTVLRYKESEDMWFLHAQDRQYMQVADVKRRWEVRSGIVWCPTTETGTWLARRDGHTFFTGNCPAHDAVSETIVGLRVWEPRETTLTLQVCSSAEPGQVMVDFGSQVGWFSLLAASCGMAVHAFDADAADVEILRTSAAINDWGERVLVDQYRVGPESEPWEPQPIRFAKIDIEGAEDQAVRVLWPSIEAGLVDHMLIEVSPVFADYYPDLVASILDAGYTGYLLPPKSQPPARLDVFPDDLEAGRLDPATVRETVAGWSQENVWVARDGASW